MERRLKLLLVDDDEVDRLAIARALRVAGLEAALDEADSVSAAAAALRARAFDCVLLDYQLPEGTASTSSGRSARRISTRRSSSSPDGATSRPPSS